MSTKTESPQTFTVSLSRRPPPVNSRRVSLVDVRGGGGFAFVFFFQYVLWTEDQKLTSEKKQAAGLTFAGDAHLS